MSKHGYKHFRYSPICMGNEVCKEFFGICECVQYYIRNEDITTYLCWQFSCFWVLNSKKYLIKFYSILPALSAFDESCKVIHTSSFDMRRWLYYFILFFISGVDGVDRSWKFYGDFLQVSLCFAGSLNFPSTQTILMLTDNSYLSCSVPLVILLFHNQFVRISTTTSLLAP